MIMRVAPVVALMLALIICGGYGVSANASENATTPIPEDALEGLLALGLSEDEAAIQYENLILQGQKDLAALEEMTIEPLPEELATLNASQREGNVRANGTEYGPYPTYSGTILVTTEPASFFINTGHAAIVYNENYAIEAMGALVNKVRYIYNDWYNKTARVYGAYVKYLSAANMQQAANKAKTWIGKPFNYDFTNYTTRSKFYCAQVVWAAYKDTFGIDLNTYQYYVTENGQIKYIVHPYALLLSNMTTVFYNKTGTGNIY